MFLRLLRLIRELEPNRHFGKLWLSQLLSLTAFNMVNFTLLIRVFDLTGSTTLVSLFVLSFGIPSLLFGAVAGALADRWNRQRVLIVTNLLRTLTVLLYLPALDSLPVIYVATFVMATVTQFFTPAEAALIPELVERKRLVAANAVFMMTLFVSFILGYGLAGPLAATGGDQLPIIVAAVMFGIATIACLSLPRVPQPAAAAVALLAVYRSVVSSVRDGFRVVRRSGALQYGIWQLTFVWATVGVVMVILPAFTERVLELNLREVSRLIILPIGAGMLLGGFALHWFRRHFGIRPIITVSLLISGVAIALLGQVTALSELLRANGLGIGSAEVAPQVTTGILSVAIGLTIAMVMIAAQTTIHERSAPEMRGRIFGVLGMSINAANTFPVLLAGALTDLVYVGTTVTGVGALLVLWSIGSLLIGRGTEV